jgi:hypothetical protein
VVFLGCRGALSHPVPWLRAPQKNIKVLEEQLAELKDRFMFLTSNTQGKRASTSGRK